MRPGCCGWSFHSPFASRMRICRMRPSPSMSSTVRPSISSSSYGYGRVLRADPFRLVGERPFGAVRIDPRTDVERAGVERARHVRVLAVLRDERLQEIQARRGGRDLGRVDVAVDPERRLFRGRAGRGVGDGQHPDVAALVALADRFDGDELRDFGGERLEDRRELGVAVEAVEGDGGHCGGFRFGEGAAAASAPAASRASYRVARRRRSVATQGSRFCFDVCRPLAMRLTDTVYLYGIRPCLCSRVRPRRAARPCSPPTPNCIAFPISPSCAARRTRRSWSARAGAGLCRARDHRRMLARRRRPRASRREGRGPAARHRQRIHADRRH